MKLKSKRHTDTSKPVMEKVQVGAGKHQLVGEWTHEPVHDLEVEIDDSVYEIFQDMYAQSMVQEMAELRDDLEIMDMMEGKTGKTEEELFQIGLAVKRWSAHYQWPDYDSKIEAELDLFNNMMRL